MKEMTLRLPDDVHADLMRAASEDDRSLNKEVIAILREVLATR